MKSKFCWLPTNVYSSKYMRDGFKWFSYVYVGDDGKCYSKHQTKIRLRFNHKGRVVFATHNAEFGNEFQRMANNQLVVNLVFQYNGNPLMPGLFGEYLL
tara:strand:+ start:15407 stop:15703 length:297 start_codon:yes stop_codon:yes gene_type:complete